MSCVIQTTDSLVTAPTLLPIDVFTAKTHLKSLVDEEDQLIEAWLEAAVQYFEEQTNRQIMRATWEYWLDAFPRERKIEIPHPPLVDVLSVSYVDAQGDLVAFQDGSPSTNLWQAVTPAGVHGRRGWIEPVSGQAWPTARDEAGAVRIRYQAGYAATPSEVPALIRAALLLLVGQFDQFRSELHISEGAKLERLPFGVDQMLSGFKFSAYPSQVLHRP